MSLEKPRLFNKHFAEDADPKTLHTVPDEPNPNDIAQRPSLASYSTGFPPRSMAPPQAGGQPFYGQDVNGILKDLSANVQYMQSGNYYPFDANFQTAVGGYNKFAVVLNPEDGKLYQSLVDNNTAQLSDAKSWFFFTDGKYLQLTGGTVTGDTNFTAKLQNKGNDVATTNQLPKTEYWYVGGSKDSPLIVEIRTEYRFNNPYGAIPVIFIPQLYIDKTKSTDGKSRWVEINGRFDDSRVNDGLSFKTAEVVNDNGISYEVGIIVALSSIVAKNDRLSQIPKQWIDVNVTRAPFRVKVIKLA